jgi:hypothetical protein
MGGRREGSRGVGAGLTTAWGHLDGAPPATAACAIDTQGHLAFDSDASPFAKRILASHQTLSGGGKPSYWTSYWTLWRRPPLSSFIRACPRQVVSGRWSCGCEHSHPARAPKLHPPCSHAAGGNAWNSLALPRRRCPSAAGRSAGGPPSKVWLRSVQSPLHGGSWHPGAGGPPRWCLSRSRGGAFGCPLSPRRASCRPYFSHSLLAFIMSPAYSFACVGLIWELDSRPPYCS